VTEGPLPGGNMTGGVVRVGADYIAAHENRRRAALRA
jgi:hypothetical protein